MKSDSNLVPLNTNHMQGVFFFGGLSFFVAFLVFLTELGMWIVKKLSVKDRSLSSIKGDSLHSKV